MPVALTSSVLVSEVSRRRPEKARRRTSGIDYQRGTGKHHTVRSPIRHAGLARLRRLTVLSAASVLLAACGSSTSAQLRAPGSGGSSGSVQSERPGAPYIVAMPVLCTTGAPLTISSVTAADPVGMRVVDWGVRNFNTASSGPADNVGSTPGLVSRLHGFSHSPVTAQCASKSVVGDFDVSVAFTGTRGTIQGVDVSYGSGQNTAVIYPLALCSTPKCALPS
jgi:hypothetical protein